MKTYNAEVVLHWGLDANKSEPINYDISIVKTQFSATILLLASFMVTGTCCNTCYKEVKFVHVVAFVILRHGLSEPPLFWQQVVQCSFPYQWKP